MVKAGWSALSLCLFTGLLIGRPAFAQRGPDCPALPRHFPMPRDASSENLPSDEWRARNDALSQRTSVMNNPTPDIVFIGDSITETWDQGVFRHFYGGYNTVNLGLWGDQTQGALFRLDTTQWGNLRPRLAVLLIGTNNLSFNSSPNDVALGIAELVRFIHQRSPATKILILGILPRGASADDPIRAAVSAVNQRVSSCADNDTIFYQDPGQALLEPDGSFTYTMSYDLLHPTPVGYAILGASLQPTIQSLVGKASQHR